MLHTQANLITKITRQFTPDGAVCFLYLPPPPFTTDYQAIACISRISKAVRSIHFRACGISAAAPFIIPETFNFYFSAQTAKLLCVQSKISIGMQENFHLDGKIFLSRCNRICITMKNLRYRDENGIANFDPQYLCCFFAPSLVERLGDFGFRRNDGKEKFGVACGRPMGQGFACPVNDDTDECHSPNGNSHRRGGKFSAPTATENN